MEFLTSLPCHSVPTWTEHCSGSNNALSWTNSPAVYDALKFGFIRRRRKQWVGREGGCGPQISRFTKYRFPVMHPLDPRPNGNNNRSPYCSVWKSARPGQLTWIRPADRKLSQVWLLGNDGTWRVHDRPVVTGTTLRFISCLSGH